MATYTIIRTQNWTYRDSTLTVVEGFKVWFFIPEFNETHWVYVPDLTPATVKAKIDKFITDRKGLTTE